MKRIALPAAAAALAACTGAPDAVAENASPRTMAVSGSGEASAVPDMAALSIGVETEGATAADALRQNGVQMNATIDRLKANGVAEKDMQTRNLSVSPRYQYDDNGAPPKIAGYVATNMLSVKLRDLDKAGAIIDEAVKDGANTLGGLSFGFAETDELENAARRDAVADAQAKAAILAEAAGVGLGPILRIEEGYVSAPPQPYVGARAMAAEMKATPISAGESTITATVTLIYEIR